MGQEDIEMAQAERVEEEAMLPPIFEVPEVQMTCPACYATFDSGSLEMHYATHKIITRWDDLVRRSLTGLNIIFLFCIT